ncbi:MAG: FAD-dependent oxidoreductase [Proteobacteria bacterium]|nr:FAD-dependent oxidoreductase [Pseudomonadota bacterium]
MNGARRRVLAGAGALVAAGCAPALPKVTARRRPRVVVVGGGYGGATAAHYLSKWGRGSVDVTLVERESAFVSSPLSNLVVAGALDLAAITVRYDALRQSGVTVIHDEAIAIDPGRRRVRLMHGPELAWDKLVLSPGIDRLPGRIAGLDSAEARQVFVSAWRAGAETTALRRQLEAMRDGGVFAISIPIAPIRCPPAPYARACLVASYLKRAKPRSKVIVLDGNSDLQSEKALFTRTWQDDYRGIVEYRHDCVLTGVDLATRTARFEIADDVTADVLNVIPPHGAGAIAHQAGVVTANGQWCEVKFENFESIRVPGVHVLGDSIQTAPVMPKSGHMANQHGKAVAFALLGEFAGHAPDPLPVLTSTCYSFVDPRRAGHVASVHRYDAAQRTYLPVPGAGGVAPAATEEEARNGMAWAHMIWRDMLGQSGT